MSSADGTRDQRGRENTGIRPASLGRDAFSVRVERGQRDRHRHSGRGRRRMSAPWPVGSHVPRQRSFTRYGPSCTPRARHCPDRSRGHRPGMGEQSGDRRLRPHLAAKVHPRRRAGERHPRPAPVGQRGADGPVLLRHRAGDQTGAGRRRAARPARRDTARAGRRRRRGGPGTHLPGRCSRRGSDTRLGIPMATDIAFAVGILALLGRQPRPERSCSCSASPSSTTSWPSASSRSSTPTESTCSGLRPRRPDCWSPRGCAGPV